LRLTSFSMANLYCSVFQFLIALSLGCDSCLGDSPKPDVSHLSPHIPAAAVEFQRQSLAEPLTLVRDVFTRTGYAVRQEIALGENLPQAETAAEAKARTLP
jgi:hypothetical protein